MSELEHKIGLSAHLNKEYEFQRLYDLYRQDFGVWKNRNPEWLGLPYIFHVPVVRFVHDADSGWQVPTITVYHLNMYAVELAAALGQCLVFEVPKTDGMFYIVHYEVTPSGQHGLRLAGGSLDLTKQGQMTTGSYYPMMSLYGEKDVERLMSCYFSMGGLGSLHVGSLRKMED